MCGTTHGIEGIRHDLVVNRQAELGKHEVIGQ